MNKKSRLIALIIWFTQLSLAKKIGLVGLLLFISWQGTSFFKKSDSEPQYQTSVVERGTLVVTVTSSGTVTSANNTPVTTAVSGVVQSVYVKNGDLVTVGSPIAEIDADLAGRQRATQALSSYQSAKNNLDTAQTSLYTTQSDLFTKWQSFMDLAQNETYENSDGTPNAQNRNLPEFIISNNDWLASQSKYKNQQNVIAAAQTAATSAWLSYQETSPIISAPLSGRLTGFSLEPGSVLTLQIGDTGNANSQRIASIVVDAAPWVSVNLTEIDAPKVKVGYKATLTFDAYPDKTYTGKVVSIDTVGTVSTGVSSYPTVIRLDETVPEIYTNMSSTANIITNIRDNVLLVPSSSIQTQSGVSTVQVSKNGMTREVNVITGLSSDTQTEIVSGLSEGETIVTGSVNSTTSTTRGQSVFSPFGRGGFGGGGGAVRVAR